MKNYVTYEDFLPVLKSNKTLTITTEYNRPDTMTPFVNTVVISRLLSEKKISVTKVGPSRLEVKRI